MKLKGPKVSCAEQVVVAQDRTGVDGHVARVVGIAVRIELAELIADRITGHIRNPRSGQRRIGDQQIGTTRQI